MELEPIYLDNLPNISMAGKVRNPFRNKILHAQFDACIFTFDTRGESLIKIDRRNNRAYQSRGNSWATHFWWGYNLTHKRSRYEGSYDTPAYACWRAGLAIRQALI